MRNRIVIPLVMVLTWAIATLGFVLFVSVLAREAKAMIVASRLSTVVERPAEVRVLIRECTARLPDHSARIVTIWNSPDQPRQPVGYSVTCQEL